MCRCSQRRRDPAGRGPVQVVDLGGILLLPPQWSNRLRKPRMGRVMTDKVSLTGWRPSHAPSGHAVSILGKFGVVRFCFLCQLPVLDARPARERESFILLCLPKRRTNWPTVFRRPYFASVTQLPTVSPPCVCVCVCGATTSPSLRNNPLQLAVLVTVWCQPETQSCVRQGIACFSQHPQPATFQAAGGREGNGRSCGGSKHGGRISSPWRIAEVAWPTQPGPRDAAGACPCRPPRGESFGGTGLEQGKHTTPQDSRVGGHG